MITPKMIFIELCKWAESFLIVYFVTCIFPFREEKQKQNWMKRIALCIAVFAISEVGFSFSWNDLTVSVLWFLILLLFCRLYLQGELLIQIIWILAALLFIPVINISLLQLMMMIEKSSIHEYINVGNDFYLIGVFLSKLLYGICIFCVCYIVKKKEVLLLKEYVYAAGAVMMYSLLMEYCLLQLMYLIPDGSAKWILGIAGGIVVIDIYLLVSMYKISKVNHQTQQIEIMKQQMQYQQKHIQDMQKSDLQIKRMSHDYKNNVQNIQELLEQKQYAKAELYVKDLTKYYSHKSIEKVDTGNAMIDAVINTRISLCQEENIPLYCTIIGNLQEVQGFKTATVLFNLLDNAIEASREEDNPEIFLEMRQREKELFCSIKNRITESVLQKNPKLKTSKKEKQKHGIGISHVQELVEEMHGILLIEEKEGFFCVECVLELEQKKEDV